MKTIFVIDDDQTSRTMLTKLVETPERRVLALPDAIECIDLLRTHEPDAIILDLDMPIFDGERFIDYLAGVAPEIIERVIIVSGSSSLLRRRSWPVRAVLEKPVDVPTLLRLLEWDAESGRREE
ncbi:MAG TPA: response regulator [Thermoanaerobaculia bacterium]|nr:response regulator [Thermoanaerobaculia bacterium]